MIDEFWQMCTSCKYCHNQNIKFVPPQKAPSDINANIKLFSLGLETPNNDLALSQVNEWGSRVDSMLLCALWPLRPMAWPKAALKGGSYMTEDRPLEWTCSFLSDYSDGRASGARTHELEYLKTHSFTWQQLSPSYGPGIIPGNGRVAP